MPNPPKSDNPLAKHCETDDTARWLRQEEEVMPTDPRENNTERVPVTRPGVEQSGSGLTQDTLLDAAATLYRAAERIRELEQELAELRHASMVSLNAALTREEAERMAQELNDLASFAETEEAVIGLIADALQRVAGAAIEGEKK